MLYFALDIKRKAVWKTYFYLKMSLSKGKFGTVGSSIFVGGYGEDLAENVYAKFCLLL